MTKSLTKFIPSELRLEIAQSVIEVKGIRPLAREIDVNPKSVFKYKKGTSHPGDEVMSKILAVAAKDESVPLDDYLSRLSEEFSEAIESPIVPEEELPEGVGEGTTETVKSPPSGEETVDQETTEAEEKAESVEERSTEPMTLEGVFEKIGVTSPFNQSKVRKVLTALEEEGDLDQPALVEFTGLSEDAVEKYMEMLESAGIVEEKPSGSFTTIIKVEGGD